MDIHFLKAIHNRVGADEMNVQESFVTALDGSEIYLRKWLPYEIREELFNCTWHDRACRCIQNL